jgi:hypothetical protein
MCVVVKILNNRDPFDRPEIRVMDAEKYRKLADERHAKPDEWTWRYEKIGETRIPKADLQYVTH